MRGDDQVELESRRVRIVAGDLAWYEDCEPLGSLTFGAALTRTRSCNLRRSCQQRSNSLSSYGMLSNHRYAKASLF